MFRSVASLIAKKTAIVAITGVTLIGGATLALADGHLVEPPADVIAVVDDPATCDDETTTDTTEECPVDDPATCDDESTPGTTEECPVDDPATCDDESTPGTTEQCPVETCTDDAGNPIDCPVAEEDPTCTDDAGNTIDCPVDDGTAEDTAGDDADLDEVAGEHPENHGKYVSEAAKGAEGSPCAGLTGKAKGQCVSGVAQSDQGKKGAEAPAEEPALTEAPAAEEPVVEDAPAEEPAAQTLTAPAEKPGKGNGKGKKG